ncbi:hypothetical protein Hanom_Chr04g00302901 [Helianthus anomalus]
MILGVIFICTLVLSFLAPSPPGFPVFFAPIGFLTVVVRMDETVLTGADPFVSGFAKGVSFGGSMTLKSEGPSKGSTGLAETGDDGKVTSSAELLATSFWSNCLYSSAALEVYLASIFPPSVHPCCLKKTWARLLPPKLIIFN